MTSFELGEHIEELARGLGVFIIPPWVGSFAEAEEYPAGAAGFIEVGEEQGAPIIWISEEPTNAKAYLVALHELGHHATSDLSDGKDTLTREHLAWQWAEGASRIPITPHLTTFIARRLDTYRDTTGS